MGNINWDTCEIMQLCNAGIFQKDTGSLNHPQQTVETSLRYLTDTLHIETFRKNQIPITFIVLGHLFAILQKSKVYRWKK